MNAQIPNLPVAHVVRAVQMANIVDLHFDPANPRLPLKLRGSGDAQVFAFLLRECSLVELMLSIGSQGFFEGEPLLVVPRELGGYTVVEGNRRLGAVKLLTSDEPAPVFVRQVQSARDSAQHKPQELPVLKFDSRDEILVYLGYRHITGVNEWGALEKARYLDQLARLYPDGPERNKLLAKQIGSRADYVAQMLYALELVEAANDDGFFDKAQVDPDSIPFSLLTTSLSYRSISEFVAPEAVVSNERLRKLFWWLFVEENGRTRVGESRNLKVLARVVSDKRALEAFEKGVALEEADLFTDGPLLLVRRMFAEAERKLSTAQDNLRYASGLIASDVEQAGTIEKMARQLRSSIEAEVKVSESDA